MSNASPMRSESAASTPRRLGTYPLRQLRSTVEFAGFWAAIVLPFVLLTLVASGLAPQHPEAVGGLLVSNLVGLGLGRGYNR